LTWRDAGSDDRRIAWLGLAAATVALLALPLVGRVAPLAPGCWLHAVTGWPCPTCGSTRAVAALGRGRIVEALGWNPLVTLVALSGLVFGMAAPAWVLVARRVPVLPRPWPLAVRLLVVAAVVGNWVYLVAAGV